MTTLVLVVVGILLAIGIGAYFFSSQQSAKEKAKEAAGMAAGSALMGVGCLVQLLLSAIPIVIALLIFFWVLKGCS